VGGVDIRLPVGGVSDVRRAAGGAEGDAPVGFQAPLTSVFNRSTVSSSDEAVLYPRDEIGADRPPSYARTTVSA
jgi:hypothetical protein